MRMTNQVRDGQACSADAAGTADDVLAEEMGQRTELASSIMIRRFPEKVGESEAELEKHVLMLELFWGRRSDVVQI